MRKVYATLSNWKEKDHTVKPRTNLIFIWMDWNDFSSLLFLKVLRDNDLCSIRDRSRGITGSP